MPADQLRLCPLVLDTVEQTAVSAGFPATADDAVQGCSTLSTGISTWTLLSTPGRCSYHGFDHVNSSGTQSCDTASRYTGLVCFFWHQFSNDFTISQSECSQLFQLASNPKPCLWMSPTFICGAKTRTRSSKHNREGCEIFFWEGNPINHTTVPDFQAQSCQQYYEIQQHVSDAKNEHSLQPEFPYTFTLLRLLLSGASPGSFLSPNLLPGTHQAAF